MSAFDKLYNKKATKTTALEHCILNMWTFEPDTAEEGATDLEAKEAVIQAAERVIFKMERSQFLHESLRKLQAALTALKAGEK